MEGGRKGVGPSAAARVLRFSFTRRSYAIFLSDVSGLSDIGRIRKVAGAPDGIMGLSPWRGRLLAVLDLPLLVGDISTGHRPSLVRLAGPFTKTALFVPSAITMENIVIDEIRPCRTQDFPVDGILSISGKPVLLLKPALFVEQLEGTMLGVSLHPVRDDRDDLSFARGF
jgi:chemotaxis signal transduction protein